MARVTQGCGVHAVTHTVGNEDVQGDTQFLDVSLARQAGAEQDDVANLGFRCEAPHEAAGRALVVSEILVVAIGGPRASVARPD